MEANQTLGALTPQEIHTLTWESPTSLANLNGMCGYRQQSSKLLDPWFRGLSHKVKLL